MRHALDAYETQSPTPEQTDELFFLWSFVADAIEKSWTTIQSEVRKGIEGRKLTALLRELSGQIDEAVQTCRRFQNQIETMPEGAIMGGKPGRLRADMECMEYVRQKVTAHLKRVNVPSLALDLEKLKALESGPFVRLTDLQARRGSTGLK